MLFKSGVWVWAGVLFHVVFVVSMLRVFIASAGNMNG